MPISAISHIPDFQFQDIFCVLTFVTSQIYHLRIFLKHYVRVLCSSKKETYWQYCKRKGYAWRFWWSCMSNTFLIIARNLVLPYNITTIYYYFSLQMGFTVGGSMGALVCINFQVVLFIIWIVTYSVSSCTRALWWCDHRQENACAC